MNVSSVKNLNGETFSAVQDATLTDVVQTNSGNWQDITAYQSNSANYLTSIPSDLDLNNISANNVVFKDINETHQGDVSTAFTANLTDYGWGIGCDISTDTFGYSSLDMKLSADLPITGTNYITIGVHQEYNEHFAVWKVPYDQIDLMNTLKINEYLAHFQYLANTLTGTDNITFLDVFDEGTSTMSTGVGNFVISYPGVVTQPITFSSFYTNYGNTSSMFSGAIDYVSANAGGGGGEGVYVPLSARSLSIGTYNSVGTQLMTQAFAHGTNNTAQYNGYSFGGYNSANSNCLSVGTRNYTNKNSIAVGYYNTATNDSQAFGDHVSATNSGMAIGTYNNITTGAFVIGNGASGNPSDAFIIYHDGSVSAAGKISANGVELGAGGGGYNETVLWSGADTTSTQTLSENITAFEEIKVYGKSHNFYPWISQVWVNSGVVYGVGSQMYSIVPPEYDISRYCLSGHKITPMKGSWYTWANGTTATTGDLTGNADQVSYICKVVGINRKQ